MNRRGQTERTGDTLKQLATDLDGYNGYITFGDFRACCVRARIGVDRRTAKSWLEVALIVEMLAPAVNSNTKITLYQRGPKFSLFLRKPTPQEVRP